MNKQSFATNTPELVEEWHLTKNEELAAYNVTPFSDKIVQWKCPKGDDHEWHGCWLPQFSFKYNKKFSREKNDFGLCLKYNVMSND